MEVEGEEAYGCDWEPAREKADGFGCDVGAGEEAAEENPVIDPRL